MEWLWLIMMFSVGSLRRARFDARWRWTKHWRKSSPWPVKVMKVEISGDELPKAVPDRYLAILKIIKWTKSSLCTVEEGLHPKSSKELGWGSDVVGYHSSYPNYYQFCCCSRDLQSIWEMAWGDTSGPAPPHDRQSPRIRVCSCEFALIALQWSLFWVHTRGTCNNNKYTPLRNAQCIQWASGFVDYRLIPFASVPTIIESGTYVPCE